MNWPTDIAIAAADVPALNQVASGLVIPVGNYAIHEACAAYLRADDDWSIWVHPDIKNYRNVWVIASTGDVWKKGTNRDADRGNPDMQLKRWGENVDVDHLLPRSWVPFAMKRLSLVRLWPVWGEVNRSWGAGFEKARRSDLEHGLIPFPEPRRGIWYAKSAQILKILGMKGTG
jgi:hypothetical protein